MTSTFAKMTKFASVIHGSCQSSKFNIKLNYNKASEKNNSKTKIGNINVKTLNSFNMVLEAKSFCDLMHGVSFWI